MSFVRSSICSLGVDVDFYWVECADGNHISAAVERLWAEVGFKPGRLRNPYVERMVRAEFRDRLEAAARGELEPIDQVKSIEDQPFIDMFEVRWSGMSMRERDPETGADRSVSVEVRLYYVELNTIGHCVLGCHAHEKWLGGSAQEVREEQDREIATAVEVYADGWPTRWGVPELTVDET